MSSITDIIAQVAQSKGVNPNLAIATAEVESGLNPQAVGDQGTSFGLFQLHRGGELGNLSVAQAFDPFTNANTALNAFVPCESLFSDPGQIAACAQRPANPGAYASKVDAALQSLLAGGGGVTTAFAGSPSSGSTSPSLGAAIGGVPASIGHGLANALSASLSNVATFAKNQIVAIIVALVVVLVLFGGGKAAQ